jgi:alkanesulfonate monooxygenase SsuD/methylene tetrahydromethanopterin reductase-like flavin-dependent oxidoreductase (luciferase family)
MKFGFALPIFANPGVPDFRTPNFEQLDWPTVASSVVEAERLGYDSVWVADHMFLGRDGAIFEGWTTLSTLAGMTSRMRLGTIHLGTGFRPPALAAKMAATLDVISGGRLEFFVDPGWREREHVAYGLDWRADRAERVERTSEALEITKRMWTEDLVTFHGKHYEVEGAICEPKPVRPPRIWIGEAFDDETLDLIVRHADVWNSMPAGPAVLEDKIARVDAACVARGRAPSTLTKTLETQVLVYEDRAEAADLFARFAELRRQHPSGDAMRDVIEFVAEGNPNLGAELTLDDLREEFVIGTPDEIVAKLEAYRALGIDEVMCWFMDFPQLTSMRAFAEEVMGAMDGRLRRAERGASGSGKVTA